MSTILIIEDEIAIHRMLCMNLSVTGYETISAYDGEEALALLQNGAHADLALVDVMLPKIDGFALLEPLKERNIHVIFLTARGDLEAKLTGLQGGAEDYIVKPFEMLELLVRMEKVLERNGRSREQIIIGDVAIDVKERAVRLSGRPLAMTPMEFDLILLLARNKNMALTRERLLSEVLGALYDGGTRTVDVHIAKLRKKTGLNIVSVPKIGYRLEVEG